MGKGFAITSDLNLGKMLLAGYARHVVEHTANGENGHSEANPLNKKRKLSRLPPIRIAAITNDTVATFTSLAYAVKAAPNSRVAMGVSLSGYKYRESDQLRLFLLVSALLFEASANYFAVSKVPLLEYK
jgi:hypothetical protein